MVASCNGEELHSLRKGPITHQHMVGWCAAENDYYPLHHDGRVAQRMKLTGAPIQGTLTFALLGQMIQHGWARSARSSAFLPATAVWTSRGGHYRARPNQSQCHSVLRSDDSGASVLRCNYYRIAYLHGLRYILDWYAHSVIGAAVRIIFEEQSGIFPIIPGDGD